MATTKEAIITGGASGMGLAVAQGLAERGGWRIHLLDINEEQGKQVAQDLPQAVFHKVDVTKYDSLATAFRAAFAGSASGGDGGGGRLDFVFANAGVIERSNFYGDRSGDAGDALEPPPEPNLHTIDADLKGVVFTTYLAQYYFRRSDHGGKGCSLVITASCGGLYPSYYSPLYSAAKHGVVGFMRSVAPHFWQEGIRVNAICPGIVRTGLVDKGGWDSFPPHQFIPVETIRKIVLMLLDGQDNDQPQTAGMTDTAGKHVAPAKAFGRAVEISTVGYYFREQHSFCDDGMASVMASTVVENQIGAILNEDP